MRAAVTTPCTCTVPSSGPRGQKFATPTAPAAARRPTWQWEPTTQPPAAAITYILLLLFFVCFQILHWLTDLTRGCAIANAAPVPPASLGWPSVSLVLSASRYQVLAPTLRIFAIETPFSHALACLASLGRQKKGEKCNLASARISSPSPQLMIDVPPPSPPPSPLDMRLDKVLYVRQLPCRSELGLSYRLSYGPRNVNLSLSRALIYDIPGRLPPSSPFSPPPGSE